MTVVRDTGLHKPSVWWPVVAAICIVLAIGAAIGASVVQRDATRLIGEGDVFSADIHAFNDIIADSEDPDFAVRSARNEFEVEAVSVIDADGNFEYSTSETLLGQPLDNPMLLFGVAERRFSAIAGEVIYEIRVDGVTEWPAGSILYQVVAPIPDRDASLMIHYDLSEMLARRAQESGVQDGTLQLLGLALLFAVLAGVVMMGHNRAGRRHRELELESDLILSHSRELEAANADLEEARLSAERALALAEEKMRIRSEFILMINHELRTPLTSVVTGAELLSIGDMDEPEDHMVLDAMVHDGRRLLEMIDQILAVARIENRGLTYTMEDLPLSYVCDSVQVANRKIDPSEVAEHPGVFVHTDLKTLNMVVASLADNARTHGASSVRVECSLEPRISAAVEVGHRPDTAVFFTVSDDGPGIEPDFIPRVFEKFEKSSDSSGTGLGLYLSRLMVEAMEGSLGVASSPSGTIFQIALPMVTAPEMAGAR